MIKKHEPAPWAPFPGTMDWVLKFAKFPLRIRLPEEFREKYSENYSTAETERF